MNIKKSFVGLLLFFTSVISYAQYGTIRGVVIDDETGETLIGVNVVIKGTTTGASTDLDGAFSIKAPEGVHTIEASYISYARLNIEDVKVVDGEVNNLGELRLKVDAIQTKTVVITAKISRNNETALVTMQKKSANVMDGISSQTFKKAGDGDAGAAIKRVTGVSVQGGKYVFVRGLGDRYTKTTLNGMEVPGLDPDRNSIQLDIFPTNLIDNLSVFKTFTPNLSGDFTGGNIDIVTKDFPDEKNMSASASLGYNPSMNLNSDFLSYESSGKDAFAAGSGSRELPFSEELNLDVTQLILNPELVSNSTRSFNPTMGTKANTSLLNSSVSFGMGDQVNKENGMTYGYNVALSYSNSYKYYEDATYSEYFTNADNSVNDLVFIRRDVGEVGIQDVFWSGFASGSAKKGNSSLALTLMHLQNGQKQASLLDGTQSSVIDQSAIVQKHVLYYNQRSITNGLISFEHVIPEKDLKITLKSSPALALNKEPDFRQTVYEIEDDGVFISGGGVPIVQRLYRDLEEISLGNRADVEYKFKFLNDQKSVLKGGLAYTYKNRDFGVLTFKFREQLAVGDHTLDPNDILSSTRVYDPVSNPNGVNVFGFEQPSNNYEASSQNVGAYIMNELPINTVLRAVYGLRVEKFEINYTGRRQTIVDFNRDVFDDETILDETNLLPSVGLIYNIAEEANLRFNFSQTVARPSFKEKSAAQIIDALTGRTFIGNLDLEQTEIDNYDIRLEKFFPGGQLISLSGFYKKFDKPIEIVPFDQTAPDQLTPRNSSDAEVFGVELDARRNLAFIDENWSKWSVGANLTIVESRIGRRDILTPGEDGVFGTADDKSEFEEKVENKRSGEKIKKFRTLQGQSPFVVNAYVNYKNDSLGLEANISYNVQGKRLAVVGVSRSPDVFEQPFHSLNFKASKLLGKERRSSLSLSVVNILDDDREQLYESFGAEDQIFTKFSPRQTISIGYSYKF